MGRNSLQRNGWGGGGGGGLDFPDWTGVSSGMKDVYSEFVSLYCSNSSYSSGKALH